MKKVRTAGLAIAAVMVLVLMQREPITETWSTYLPFPLEKAWILHEEKEIHSELRVWRMIGKSRGYFQRDYTGYDDMVRDDPEFATFDRRRQRVERRKQELMARHPDERNW